MGGIHNPRFESCSKCGRDVTKRAEARYYRPEGSNKTLVEHITCEEQALLYGDTPGDVDSPPWDEKTCS